MRLAASGSGHIFACDEDATSKNVKVKPALGDMAKMAYYFKQVIVFWAVNFFACFIIAPPLMARMSENKWINTRLKFAHHDLQAALAKFKNSYGRYPSNNEGLSILTNCTTVELCNIYPAGGFIEKSALSDPWGTPYAYYIDERGKVTIKSLGSDSKVGGSGCSKDIDIATETYPCMDLNRFDFFKYLERFLLPLPIVTLVLPMVLWWYYFEGRRAVWFPVFSLFSIISTAAALFALLNVL